MDFIYCKLEIFIPETHLDALRRALQEVDAGHICRDPESARPVLRQGRHLRRELYRYARRGQRCVCADAAGRWRSFASYGAVARGREDGADRGAELWAAI